MKTKRDSKHQEIFAELQRAIGSGQYKEGDRLPSEVELVGRFGASRPTIARALQRLVQEGIVERRPGSGTYVRGRNPDEHYIFGLLIPELGQTEIFEPICQGLSGASQGKNHQLLWGNTTGALPKEKQAEELCRQYVKRRVSGVFFAPLELFAGKDEVNRRIATALDEASIPIVLLDRDLCQFPERSKYHLVGIDNYRAGYRITEHLLKLGCRRIVFLAHPYSAPTVRAREAGWREVMQKYQAAADPEFVRNADPADVSTVREILHSVRPEAFVCANDLTAATLMQTLNSLGVTIPTEVRIVGMDDVKYAKLLHVPLTTVHQPCQEIGFAALTAMLGRIMYPTLPAWDVLLEAPLVIRQSCGSDLGLARPSVAEVEVEQATADV
ncbi:MAG TPA: GntR family transcriptional regulator [Terriglobia bacterium]|nr:GntR family transcriptional regulator [Terriglobia bacterium]